MKKTKKNELDDYNFDEPEPPMIIGSPKNYWDAGKQKPCEWPGLGEDSYIWHSLKKYGNTVIGYRYGVALIKHAYHKLYSPHTPPEFMSNEKYAKKRNRCLNKLENYISKIIGKSIKIQLVCHDSGFQKCMFGKNTTDEENSHLGDSWLVEVKK